MRAAQRAHTAVCRAVPPLGLALLALWVTLGVAGALGGTHLAAQPSHASAYLSSGAQQRWLALARPTPPPEHTPLVYPSGLPVALEVVAGVTLLSDAAQCRGLLDADWAARRGEGVIAMSSWPAALTEVEQTTDCAALGRRAVGDDALQAFLLRHQQFGRDVASPMGGGRLDASRWRLTLALPATLAEQRASLGALQRTLDGYRTQVRTCISHVMDGACTWYAFALYTRGVLGCCNACAVHLQSVWQWMCYVCSAYAVRAQCMCSAYAADYRAQVSLTLVGAAVEAVEVTVDAPGSAIGWAAWAVAAAVAASFLLFDPAAVLLLLLGIAHAAALLLGATSLMPAPQP